MKHTQIMDRLPSIYYICKDSFRKYDGFLDKRKKGMKRLEEVLLKSGIKLCLARDSVDVITSIKPTDTPIQTTEKVFRKGRKK